MHKAHTPIAFALTAALTVAVLYGTLMPSDSLPETGSSDKVGHFIAFGALVFPLTYAQRYSALSMLIAGIIFGGAIELLQPYVGRSQDIMDWAADALGALSGVGFARALNKLGARKTS